MERSDSVSTKRRQRRSGGRGVKDSGIPGVSPELPGEIGKLEKKEKSFCGGRKRRRGKGTYGGQKKKKKTNTPPTQRCSHRLLNGGRGGRGGRIARSI